jgi:hypothetical protein
MVVPVTGHERSGDNNMRKEFNQVDVGSEKIQKMIGKAVRKARNVGGKVAQVVSETPEYIALSRNEKAIKSEIDDNLRAIGKRVMALHKKAGDSLVFARYRTISRHLDALDHLHKEYRSNRVRLNEVRQEIKGKNRK